MAESSLGNDDQVPKRGFCKQIFGMVNLWEKTET